MEIKIWKRNAIFIYIYFFLRKHFLIKFGDLSNLAKVLELIFFFIFFSNTKDEEKKLIQFYRQLKLQLKILIRKFFNFFFKLNKNMQNCFKKKKKKDFYS